MERLLEAVRRSRQKDYKQALSELTPEERRVVQKADSRRLLKVAFEKFLQEDSSFENNVLLAEMLTTSIEIFTGEDGYRVFKDLMIQANALARFRKLGEFLNREV